MAAAAALMTAAVAPMMVLAAPGSISVQITNPLGGTGVHRGEEIQFTATYNAEKGCDPVGWAWDFGNGDAATEQNPVYAYPLDTPIGQVDLRVDVFGSCGKDNFMQHTIEILNALPTAVLTGPAEVVAGETFTLSGVGSSDADGTIVAYAFALDGGATADQAEATYDTTLTTAGTHQATLTVTDNDGGQATSDPLTISVVAGPLDHIEVACPEEVVAGTTVTCAWIGADAYGNPTGDHGTFEYTAPTETGSDTACHEQDGMAACTDVTVVPDALASIVVSGPAQVVAGTTNDFSLTGYDQYGNEVQLAQNVVASTAPTQVGFYDVCYTEQDVTGCTATEVIPDAIHLIKVTPPAAVLNLGQTQDYDAAAYDQYGNSVATAFDWGSSSGTIDANGIFSPSEAGDVVITASADGVTGAATASVFDCMNVVGGTDEELYAATDALLGGIGGSVGVTLCGDGAAVEGALVVIEVTQRTLLGELLPVETIEVVTGADGTADFELPLLCHLPAEYDMHITATWMGNLGNADSSYEVVVA